MPPEAVIFDVDGLLIDSEPLWEETERRVFAKVGVDLSAEDCQQTTGLRTDEVVRYWFERQPWVDASPGEVETWILDGMVEAIAAHGLALPGAVAALEIASRLDVPLAVASSFAAAADRRVFAAARCERHLRNHRLCVRRTVR